LKIQPCLTSPVFIWMSGALREGCVALETRPKK